MVSIKKKYTPRKIHGICHLSVIPVRSNPTDHSILIGQILYGETCQIITKKHNDWARVQLDWDGLEGWIRYRQITPITEKQHVKLGKRVGYALELVQSSLSGNQLIPLVLGSSLPQYDGLSYVMPDEKYIYNGLVYAPHEQSVKLDWIRKIAMKYLHAPYLPGGRTPFGIDTGAFVQMVYKMIGIRLSRIPAYQAKEGDWIHFVHEARPGDLAFFENQDGRIDHAGIVLGDGKIIHVDECVRIDELDHFGIYNRERKNYTHPLRMIRRVIENKENEESEDLDQTVLSQGKE